MWSVGAFILFTMLALIGPGIALQRLARVPAEPALVLPLGAAVAAGAYWLALASGHPYVFPILVLALDLALFRRAQPRDERDEPAGHALRGALPAIGATVVMLALTQYPFNRPTENGEFR